MLNKRQVKIEPQTLETLKALKRELSVIENKDIALGEIIKRMSSGEDVRFRLKQGALDRKNGIK
jgi:hypothetical protein